MILDSKKRPRLYDKLHRGSLIFIGALSIFSFGLVGYHLHLFKTEVVPSLQQKYREKLEKQIENQQREAELLEQQRAAERELKHK